MAIDFKVFLENRANFPPEGLVPYSGCWVAWSPDGTHIVASSSESQDAVDKQLEDAGLVRAVEESRRKGEEVQAIVGADKLATHGAVTHLLDVLKGAGVTKFAIQIEKP